MTKDKNSIIKKLFSTKDWIEVYYRHDTDNPFSFYPSEIVKLPLIIWVPIYIIQMIIILISIPIGIILFYGAKFYYKYICRNNLYIFCILNIIFIILILLYSDEIRIFIQNIPNFISKLF